MCPAHAQLPEWFALAEYESEVAEAALDEFVAEGIVTEILHVIKRGKEAGAYLCRVDTSLGAEFAVAKVYHERSRRNFAKDGAYHEGRVILNGQVRRAIAARTEVGLQAQGAMWVDHEFQTLSDLHYAGADVPEPFYSTERAILMEYVGGELGPAPQLQQAQLERDEAVALFERLLWNVELFLSYNLVHADLSPFNVLYGEGRAVVIDFPQAVDPRFNRHARALLERDVANLGRYFAKYGVHFDAERHAAQLWEWWRYGAGSR